MEKKSHKTIRNGNIALVSSGFAAGTVPFHTITVKQQQRHTTSSPSPGALIMGGVGCGSSGGKQRNSQTGRHHSQSLQGHDITTASHHNKQHQQQLLQHATTAATTSTVCTPLHANRPAQIPSAISKVTNVTSGKVAKAAGTQIQSIAATAAVEHGIAAGFASKAISPTMTATTAVLRNKNEEAINDLRQRIPEIENIFDVHSRIGNGTFSTVLLGTLKKERNLPENMRRKFAIKHHIPTSHPDRIMKELQCMAKIGGTDNVVGINCCIRYNESVAFIMPYMPHDRFHDFFNKMELAELQHYMRNLLIALRHVHKFNVIHRDVKPSNFLYNRRKRQFLLVDFGLAQQVPTPAPITGSVGATEIGSEQPLTLGTGTAEGKRPRDGDDYSTSNKTADSQSSAMASDAYSGSKRPRCSGPGAGDAQETYGGYAAANTAHVRVANSCIVGGGGGGVASPFKMPLKQLNEISQKCNAAVGQTTINATVAQAVAAATGVINNSGNSNATDHGGICESSLGRQAKSAAILGGSNRMPQQTATGATASTANATVTQCTTESGGGIANNKYKTNRNLSTANAAKCNCYGNPQVCNICLVKKEIHASRAGTPGYRPPEVLLKYADQTTAVDIWAAGVIFLSILSSVYPFFKAPSDFVALAEMVTIFGDKTIRKTAFALDRLLTLSQKTKPLDLRKLCVRFRNRVKFSSPELLRKYQRANGGCEVCRNCDQFYFNCLCAESQYHNTEPLDDDDPFPASAYDLLYKLLEVNPHQRISAEEALKHAFFSETDVKVDNNNSNKSSNNNNNKNDVVIGSEDAAVVAAAATCRDKNVEP